MKLYRGRFRSTEITFGPAGRVVATLALFLPVWFFLQSGLLGAVGLVIWGGWVLPRGLRDVWRDVPWPGQVRADRRHLMAPRAGADADVAISDRETPTRW